MFNKLKQFKDLRDKAKEMQAALAQEVVTSDKNGVTIVINGNLEVLSVKFENISSKDRLESNTKDCFNDAVKKVQKVMAQKMQQMGGIPGLS